MLIALHITADPSLQEERRLQFALRRMDARSAYENAASQGMAGRDLTGKGYISLDFFNLFWLFTIGCVFGLVIETIYLSSCLANTRTVRASYGGRSRPSMVSAW